MENLVEVKNLADSYFTYAGEVQSVRGVTFDIKSGKTTAIVGESGCGKTETAKTLMGQRCCNWQKSRMRKYVWKNIHMNYPEVCVRGL